MLRKEKPLWFKKEQFWLHLLINVSQFFPTGHKLNYLTKFLFAHYTPMTKFKKKSQTPINMPEWLSILSWIIGSLIGQNHSNSNKWAEINKQRPSLYFRSNLDWINIFMPDKAENRVELNKIQIVSLNDKSLIKETHFKLLFTHKSPRFVFLPRSTEIPVSWMK